MKPLDCKIYPLTFIFRKGKFEFYLNKSCPHLDKISKEWIKETKKEFLKEVKKWDKEAVKIYSKISEEEDLTPVN